MHNYTTGEVAKICNVSVRCIQYYDSRDILIPSSLSEGGRRLYSEEDVKKLKIICFLRNNGLSINTIKELMKEENNMEVISLLLKQQQEQLQNEISQKKQQLETLQLLSNEMNHMEQISLQSIQDARIIMKNKKDLNRTYFHIVFFGIGVDVLEWIGLFYLFMHRNWIPILLFLPIIMLSTISLLNLYYHKTIYICPVCHHSFKPIFKEFVFSKHTFHTRKLTCPHCHHNGYCVETYDDIEV